MEQYKNLDIVEMPLGSPFFSDMVSRFLGVNGLRMEAMDTYYAVQGLDGRILAGAGISKDIIKCVAVAQEARSEGLMVPLISRIVAGRGNLKVFTKPEYRDVFESLGFHLLGQAPKAILLENGRGLQQYCEYLKELPSSTPARTDSNGLSSIASPVPQRTGVIVMNANPFTLGHKYLIEKAMEQVDRLYVIPVREDVSMFPYSERREMICLACAPSSSASYTTPTREQAIMPGSDQASHVVVVDGSAYTISAATFPTYFLKDLTEASEQQMLLDLDIFAKHIAPALGATVRFAGSEPSDPLTARYNALMADILPKRGIEFVEIPRLCETPNQVGSDTHSQPGRAHTVLSGCAHTVMHDSDHSVMPGCTHTVMPDCDPSVMPGCSHTVMPDCDPSVLSGCARVSHAITATDVRMALNDGNYAAAAAMCPATTHPYLLAAMAERALRMELDTPLKPGLVCPESNGAHKDMDYGTMLKGIAAIRPFFPAMARSTDHAALRQLGIDAENAMLTATGGVNTHRGAIFALGLALNAAFASYSAEPREMQRADTQCIIQNTLGKIAQGILRKSLIDNDMHFTLIGAKRIALSGYQQLFEDWLPFYRRLPVAAGNDERGVAANDDAGVSGNENGGVAGRNDESTAGNDERVAAANDDAGVSGNENGGVTGRNDGSTAGNDERGAAANDDAGVSGNENGGVTGRNDGSTAGNENGGVAGSNAGCPAGNDARVQALLLHIMSTLDDTCIIKRVGKERAEKVKQEASKWLDSFASLRMTDMLSQMCDHFAAEGISPGGAADMVALTIFIDSII